MVLKQETDFLIPEFGQIFFRELVRIPAIQSNFSRGGRLQPADEERLRRRIRERFPEAEL